MSDLLDKLRAAPFIIGSDAEAERLRKLWKQFVDGEIEARDCLAVARGGGRTDLAGHG